MSSYVINLTSMSAVGFFLLSKLIKSQNCGTELISNSNRSKWLWRNTFCSLVHSTISALWTIYCYIEEPKLLKDMIHTYSTTAYFLVMFSTGYFIYDYFDIVIHDKFRQWELMFHHTVVLCAFGIALYHEKYIGFAVCSLIMEFNSIFLHLRRLLKMNGMHSTQIYSLNSVFLLLTMVFCRICTSAWMVRWLFQNQQAVQFLPYIIGIVGMTIVTATNIGLMYRLCVVECSKKKQLHEIKK